MSVDMGASQGRAGACLRGALHHLARPFTQPTRRVMTSPRNPTQDFDGVIVDSEREVRRSWWCIMPHASQCPARICHSWAFEILAKS